MIENTKTKTLIAIIVFLLATNIAILVFFLFVDKPGKKMHSREVGIATFLKKDINFDDKQMTAYQLLKDSHIKNIKPVFDSIRYSKDIFYNLLYQPGISDSVVKNKAVIIGNIQANLEVNMLAHLKNVRNLCTPDQLPKFDSLIKNVVQRFTHGRFGKNPDKK